MKLPLSKVMFLMYSKVYEHQIEFFGYIDTYTSIMYAREYPAQGRFCCEKLGIPFIQVSS